MNHRPRPHQPLTLDANTITTLDAHHDIALGINPDGTTTIWVLDYTDTETPTTQPHHNNHLDLPARPMDAA